MRILISQRNDVNKKGNQIDNLENNYIDYLEKFGVQLMIIPNTTKKIESYFELPIHGIILSGGNNINPELYDYKIQEGMAISKKRDETEKRLLEIAIERKLPVLGICRGMQFINVFFGGKLVNIKEDVRNAINHVPKDGVKVSHTIKITDKEVAMVLGNESKVNSYHNYGVTEGTFSSELKSFAQTDDDVIEGIYHPSLPIAGVQWHPERKSPDEEINKKIINAFLNKELFWKK